MTDYTFCGRIKMILYMWLYDRLSFGKFEPAKSAATKVWCFMSYVSAQAKAGVVDQFPSKKHYIAMEAAKIDRSETSFGGKGCLTNEQYYKGMSLSREMRKKSAW